ncbi:hypothetical protein FMEAI12_3640084 [Parafrankia sp. Ea1.12]|nr:hypothetical protein FMEAI12_3640084 [Parafrankia sp. Ea1.12]
MEAGRVTPFRINTPDDTLEQIRQRLTAFDPVALPRRPGWRCGTDPTALEELTRYWLTDYDWRRHERELNAFEQFTAAVDGVEVHLLREPGSGTAPPTVLLLHGWPTSFATFRGHQQARASGNRRRRSGGRADRRCPVVARLRLLPARLGPDRRPVCRAPLSQAADRGPRGGQVLRPRRGPGCADRRVDGFRPPGPLLWATHHSPRRPPRRSAAGKRPDRRRGSNGGRDPVRSAGTQPEHRPAGRLLPPAGDSAAHTGTSPGGQPGRLRRVGAGEVPPVERSERHQRRPRADPGRHHYRDHDLSRLGQCRQFAGGLRGVPLRPDHASARRVIEVASAFAAFPDPRVATPPASFVARSRNLTHFTEPPRGGHFPSLEAPDVFAADLAGFIRATESSST